MRSVLTLTRGRKAALVSLLFHGLVLAVFSWLFPLTQAKEAEPEPYLELELSVDSDEGGGISLPQESDGAGSLAADLPTEDRVVERIYRSYSSALRQTQVIPEQAAISGDREIGGTRDGTEGGAGTGGYGDLSGGGGAGSGEGGTGSGGGNGGKSGNGAGTAVRRQLIPPTPLAQPKPAYPAVARQEGREGTVTVSIQILKNGLPGTVSIMASSGYADLDEAAVAVAYKWRFTPARDRSNGQAVVCSIKQDIVFNLNN